MFIKELTMARFVKVFAIPYDDLRFSRSGRKILSIDKQSLKKVIYDI